VSDWRSYQNEAASFFAELGLHAEVEASIGGARTHHVVDVLVRFERFGIDHTWIVECKAWNRRVAKREVMALRAIADDIGADRAILLSERGFQPAAVAAARQTSILLTDLRQLAHNAEPEVLEVRRRHLERRVIALQMRLVNLAPLKTGPDGGMSSRDAADKLLDALDGARFGRYATGNILSDEDEGSSSLAAELPTLLGRVEGILTEIEAWREELGESSSELVSRLVASTAFRAALFDLLAADIPGANLAGDPPLRLDRLVSIEEIALYGMYTLAGTPLPYFQARGHVDARADDSSENAVRGSKSAVTRLLAELKFEVALDYPSGRLKGLNHLLVTRVPGVMCQDRSCGNDGPSHALDALGDPYTTRWAVGGY